MYESKNYLAYLILIKIWFRFTAELKKLSFVCVYSYLV